MFLSCGEDTKVLGAYLFDEDIVNNPGIDYSEWNTVDPIDIELFFIENFSDNSNKWPEFDEDDFNIKVSDNEYEFNNFSSDNSFFLMNSIGLNTNRDYQVSMKLKFNFNPTSNNASIGMAIRSDTGNTFLIFGYNKNKSLYIVEEVSGDRTFEVDNNSSLDLDFFSDSIFDYNELTVRKIGSIYYFFMNQKYFYQYDSSVNHGAQVGPIVWPNSRGFCDDIEISYLNL
jgi:hypothetical protein